MFACSQTLLYMLVLTCHCKEYSLTSHFTRMIFLRLHIVQFMVKGPLSWALMCMSCYESWSVNVYFCHKFKLILVHLFMWKVDNLSLIAHISYSSPLITHIWREGIILEFSYMSIPLIHLT